MFVYVVRVYGCREVTRRVREKLKNPYFHHTYARFCYILNSERYETSAIYVDSRVYPIWHQGGSALLSDTMSSFLAWNTLDDTQYVRWSLRAIIATSLSDDNPVKCGSQQTG